MAFDGIPEDREVSYPCQCGGKVEIFLATGKWSCDTCGWEQPDDDDDCCSPEDTSFENVLGGFKP